MTPIGALELTAVRASSINVSIIVVLVAVLRCAGEVHAEQCTIAEQQRIADELPRVKNWSNVYESFKAYVPRCDDGWMAEGYTDVVVKMLAHRWAAVGELAQLVRRDSAFQSFVIRHVDASADSGDLQKVLTNTTRRCPRDLLGLCGSLAAAAEAALKETNG